MIESGRIFLLTLIFFLLFGCGPKSDSLGVKEPQSPPRQPHLIVVLPVDNQTSDEVAPKLLRTRLLDELYFKGYKKMPFDVVDRTFSAERTKTGNAKLDIERIRQTLGADAAMRCKLTESSMSVRFFYAPVSVSARCELLDTVSGKIFWSASYRATHRSFDITPNRVRMKSYGGFEAAIDELVAEVMEALPYGPELRG